MKRLVCISLAAVLCGQAYLSYAHRTGLDMVQKDSTGLVEQVEVPPPENTAADANNPLASIKSVSVHNIWTPSLYGAEGSGNVVWKRYAQPIGGKVLLRASLPVNTLATGGRSTSGLGDFNFFATWIFTKPTDRNQFGLGPIFTFPTATDKVLGSGKWSAGLAFVAYFVPNPTYQIGFLVTWQHSFAGRSDRSPFHVASIQPLFTWQLGKGLYLRSTGIIALDFTNDLYYIPFGLGIGKVLTAGKLTFNLFAEPQFTTWHYGAGVPVLQLFCGINTQF